MNNIIFSAQVEQRVQQEIKVGSAQDDRPHIKLPDYPDNFGQTYNRLIDNEVMVQSNALEQIYDDVITLDPASINITSIKRLSTVNNTTSTYTLNNFFIFDQIDLTCFHVWDSSAAGVQRRGVLITDRVILTVAHIPPTIGSTYRFINSDGNIEERTLLDVELQPNHQTPNMDMCLGLLSSPLSAKVKPAKLMNDETLSPYITAGTQNTSFKLKQAFQEFGGLYYYNRNNELLVHNWGTIPSSGRNVLEEVSALRTIPTYGDSGSASFIVINNTVYISYLVSSQFGEGTFVTIPANHIILQGMLDNLNTRQGTSELIVDSTDDFIDANTYRFEE